MGLHPDSNLPLVYLVRGYMAYEERPAIIYPNNICVLVDLLGVPTYLTDKKWTLSRPRALAIALAALEKHKAAGGFDTPDLEAKYNEIAAMYKRGQCFIRPEWSKVDLDLGDPGPLPREAEVYYLRDRKTS